MFIVKRKILIYLTLVLVVPFLFWRVILFFLRSQSQDNHNLQSNNTTVSDESIAGDYGNLPKDFPVYANSEFVTLAQSENGKGRSFVWETTDSADLVFEYFKSELKIKDWIISNETSVSNSSALNFEKNETLGFLAVFEGGGSKTVISVTIREP